MNNRRTRNTRKSVTKKVVKTPVGAIMPAIKQTRLTQATRFTHAESHQSRQGNHTIDHFAIDMKRLERNKYAPWGRGDLSGLPQGSK